MFISPKFKDLHLTVRLHVKNTGLERQNASLKMLISEFQMSRSNNSQMFAFSIFYDNFMSQKQEFLES